MIFRLILHIIVCLVIVSFVWMIPSIYDIGSYSRFYNLNVIAAKGYTITSPTNIITSYFPSPNIQATTNLTYYIDPSTNEIKLNVNNILHNFSLASNITPQIVYPLLLLSQ